MNSILNRLLKVFLGTLSLMVISPGVFAIEDGNIQVQERCQQEGYYKIIVRNDWTAKEAAFPIPIDDAQIQYVPAGSAQIVEVSEESLNRLLKVIGEFPSEDISELLNTNSADHKVITLPIQMGYGSDESQKISIVTDICLFPNCDVQRYSFENCRGHISIHLFDGHRYFLEEMERIAKEKGGTVKHLEL